MKIQLSISSIYLIFLFSEWEIYLILFEMIRQLFFVLKTNEFNSIFWAMVTMKKCWIQRQNENSIRWENSKIELIETNVNSVAQNSSLCVNNSDFFFEFVNKNFHEIRNHFFLTKQNKKLPKYTDQKRYFALGAKSENNIIQNRRKQANNHLLCVSGYVQNSHANCNTIWLSLDTRNHQRPQI